MHYYERMLDLPCRHRTLFLLLPLAILLLGFLSWGGFDNTFRLVSDGFGMLGTDIGETRLWSSLDQQFPGLGQEFMPTLDEGSFLLMPTAMPHAGRSEEHTSELQSRGHLVCRLMLEKKKKNTTS